MVKKLVVIGFAIVMMPVSQAFAQDSELVEMENEIDMQAAEIMSRRGSDREKGEEIVKGVIDLIGTIADRNERGDWDRGGRGGRGDHGRGPGWGRGPGHGGGHGGPGRHPGYGRQPKRLVCVAQNVRGQRFQADGYILERVQRRAVQSCQEMSRHPRAARSCRIVSCFEARR